MATYADSIMANLAEAEAKLAEIMAIRDKLREELLTEIKSENNGKFAGVYGKATVCTRDSYTFSNQVVVLEEQLKAQRRLKRKQESPQSVLLQNTSGLTGTDIKERD